MFSKRWNKLSTMLLFILISLILFNIYFVYNIPILYLYITPKSPKFHIPQIDSIMKDIYVPPVENSHPKFCLSGKLNNINTWDCLTPDNNIPGLLPGPRIGEQLGLENNPLLSLYTPIHTPLMDKKMINLY